MTTLFDTTSYLAFVLSAAALVAAPGPGQALVLTRTFEGGARAGLLTALGLEIGTLIHTVAASLGLSAILATSATAFEIVKYFGAGYLILLGVVAWRKAGHAGTETTPLAATANPRSDGRMLFHAAVTGTLNPKVAVFFLAFLPQFVDPARGHALVQFLVLGLTFALIGLVGDGTVAILGHRARERFLRAPGLVAWRERITGGILVALGLRLALLSRH